MNVDEVFGSKSFKAAELNGEEPILTIRDVSSKEFDDGAKLIITFEEDDRFFVCNKTNKDKIKSAFGPESTVWIGRKIQLFNDPDIWYGGKRTGGIRVRTGKKPIPVPQVPVRKNPMTDDFNDRVDDIADTF